MPHWKGKVQHMLDKAQSAGSRAVHGEPDLFLSLDLY